MPKALKNNHQKHLNIKKFLLITFSVVVGLIALFFAKQYYDTYHDRPLAKGLQYVGRDYNNPCFFGQCYGPETETYYYATDIEPKGIVKLFPGWKVGETGESYIFLRDGTTTDSRGYNIVNSKLNKNSFYSHVLDKGLVTKKSSLLSNSKAFIISISREDYDLLRHK